MRDLNKTAALARYHLLGKVRVSNAVFASSLLLAVLPQLWANALFLFEWPRELSEIEYLLPERAMAVHVVYFFHIVVLMATCDLFGRPRRTRDGSVADLTETAPLTPAERFFGDALGILQTVMVVHLCTLPLLATAVALSPLPTSVFVILEAAVLAVAVLVSAAASWKLRSAGPWSRTQSVRSMALFFILLLGVVMTTTRWEAFRDAFVSSLLTPSPQRWNEIRAAIVNPPLLVALLVLLYAGFIAYFALSSVRAIERGQENAHAL